MSELVVDGQGDAAENEEDQGENPAESHSLLSVRAVRVPEDAKADEEDYEGLYTSDDNQKEDLVTFLPSIFICKTSQGNHQEGVGYHMDQQVCSGIEARYLF